jgi:hypothetical protein
MSKKRKKKRFSTPSFYNKTQRDCFHFILEEEENEIKKNYEIDGKTFKEVEWTYNEDKGEFVVYLNERDQVPQIVYFPIESYPLLLSYWKNLKLPPKDA